MKRRKRSMRRRVRIVLLVMLVFYGFVTVQFREKMIDSAAKLARNLANEVINQTVYELMEDHAMEYSDLISVITDPNGRIISLHANASNINSLKSQTALKVRTALSKEGVQELSVPFGTLSGLTFLSGIGPQLSCRVLMSAVPEVTLQYHFDGAGINQTLHSIIMTVTVPLSVTMPLLDRDVEAKCSFLVGETILVGEVPDNYTNVISDPEVADDIFNYGDVG